MKVTVEQSVLLKSLSRTTRVVERRNTIPILSNVLLKAEKEILMLKATDLDIEVTEQIAADISTPGAITVPAHVLHDIVRKLPDGAQVSLETSGDGSQLVLRSGRARFTLQALAENDFPDLATGDFANTFTMASKNLRQLIEKTKFAISTEETRYYLNGIYTHTVDTAGGTVLRAVATDGHRLARCEVPSPEGASGMPGIIIPRKTVDEIFKLVAETETEVKIELSSTKIRLHIGTVILTSKLIDGTFPDYTRVIPSNNDKRLIVECAGFSRSVDRVATISSERGRAVKLSLNDNKLTLSVNNPDAGNATEEIEVEYSSDPLEIGFNAKYLLDIAGQFEGDTAVFKFADSGAPTLIQDREGAATLYVLMPMRV